MKRLAIIPARGGSKRIPRKNSKDFLGKPIIAYSIEAALNCHLFDEVMVSTDDAEIAEIALKFGAKVPFMRSDKTADDFATTADVISEVINEYKNREITFDFVCCIYSCAPFVNPEKLKLGLDLMENQQFDSVFPVVAFSFPIQRALRIETGELSFFQPEYALTRSQDLERAFHDAGQFYWIRISAFERENKIVMTRAGAIISDELEVQDIDHETDWRIAELKYKLITDESISGQL